MAFNLGDTIQRLKSQRNPPVPEPVPKLSPDRFQPLPKKDFNRNAKAKELLRKRMMTGGKSTQGSLPVILPKKRPLSEVDKKIRDVQMNMSVNKKK